MNLKIPKTGNVRADSAKTCLHFSDGILEIEAEKEQATVLSQTPVYDTKSMDWGPWTLHMTKQAGYKTLEVCDYVGESLASFFGITTPKYQFEINEYHRRLKEEEEVKKEADVEMGTWSKGKIVPADVVTSPPAEPEVSSNVQRF